jgi:hypothetical protein
MAGTYNTKVIGEDGRDLDEDDVAPGMSPRIEWTQASFIGRHWALGPFEVHLSPEAASSGFVEQTNRSADEFFPATNRNEFFFRIVVPRLRREYRNRAALVNVATIDAIPPIGSVYELAEPVRFENPQQGRDWWDITKCYVMMPDQKWIGIEVVSIERHGDRDRITALLDNKSPKPRVVAYWFTNSDDPKSYHFNPKWGILTLRREKKAITFDAVRTTPDADPIIELGAAVITNPIVNDPSKSGGVGTYAAHLERRRAYLNTAEPG